MKRFLCVTDACDRRQVRQNPPNIPILNDVVREHYVKSFSLSLILRSFCPQILSLGAGFDSLYFRLHSEGALERVSVFEVDFPDVARRKAASIGSSRTLKDSLADCEFLAGMNCDFFLLP